MGTHPIFESDFDCLTEWKYHLSKEYHSDVDVLFHQMGRELWFLAIQLFQF